MIRPRLQPRMVGSGLNERLGQALDWFCSMYRLAEMFARPWEEEDHTGMGEDRASCYDHKQRMTTAETWDDDEKLALTCPLKLKG
jgi:hypothetical protein